MAEGRFCPDCGTPLRRQSAAGYGVTKANPDIQKQVDTLTISTVPDRPQRVPDYPYTGDEIKVKPAKPAPTLIIFYLIFIIGFGAFPAIFALNLNLSTFVGYQDPGIYATAFFCLIFGAVALGFLCAAIRAIATGILTRVRGRDLTGLKLGYDRGSISLTGRPLLNAVIQLEDGSGITIIYPTGSSTRIGDIRSRIKLRQYKGYYTAIQGQGITAWKTDDLQRKR